MTNPITHRTVPEDFSRPQADIVVGIPSYNEAQTIAFVAGQLAQGLRRYFPDRTAVIYCLDGGSADETVGHFLAADTQDIPKAALVAQGETGKGVVLRMQFEQMVALDAAAGICVDADIESVSPEWVKWMLTPVLDGKIDYGTPLYSRHPYDGTITNHICYPLVFGTLGVDVRQPIGGDFVFSRRAAEQWLGQEWYPTTYKFGIDIFMTTHAVFGQLPIGQIGLGAKVHKPSAPNLGPMFLQVVGSLFENLDRHADAWADHVPAPLPLFGKEHIEPPQSLDVDVPLMAQRARDDFPEAESDLDRFLTPADAARVRQQFADNALAVDATWWVNILLAAWRAYRTADAAAKERIVRALRPLYFARVFSYMTETEGDDYARAEGKVLDQARLLAAAYHDRKPIG